jgi:putative ABC transport system substrate-binding protein
MARAASLVLLVVCLGGAQFAAHAQLPTGRPYRIGVILTGWALQSPIVQGLKAGLKAEGIEDGRDVVYDVRGIRGEPQAVPEIVQRIIAEGPALIFAVGEEATRAAMKASDRLPVVFIGVGDPVAARIVTSIAHPGGNVTGISGLTTELAPKRLEIFKALVPTLRRVWAVCHADDAMGETAARKAQEVGPSLGLVVMVRPVRTASELIDTLKAIPAGDGLFAPFNTYLDVPGMMLIASLSARLPAIYPSAFWVRAVTPGSSERGLGALASYGSDYEAEGVQAARLVAKILRGAKPQDVPVEGTTKIQFVINLKTARTLGLTIPPSVLARADEVIE